MPRARKERGKDKGKDDKRIWSELDAFDVNAADGVLTRRNVKAHAFFTRVISTRARDVNSWACEENKILSPVCILNEDELISQLSLEARERQIRIAGSPRWMQMWRVRGEKSATNFTRDKFHARVQQLGAAQRRGRTNENFAGAIVNFITVATFCLGTFCLS